MYKRQGESRRQRSIDEDGVGMGEGGQPGGPVDGRPEDVAQPGHDSAERDPDPQVRQHLVLGERVDQVKGDGRPGRGGCLLYTSRCV